jgi:hypothetical protein
MKMIVKLAVLFATLLLAVGVSFAGQNFDCCKCYEITATEVADPQHTETGLVSICLNYEAMMGIAYSDIGELNLALFYNKESDSLNILAAQDNSLGICLGAFGFRGHHDKYIIGIGYCDNTRWTLKGRQSYNCPGPS